MNTNNNILEWSESEIKEFMKTVWILCALGFEYKINPLPELRKQFPQFTWKYIALPSQVEQEEGIQPEYGSLFRDAHMIWDMGDGDLFATLEVQSTFGKYSCYSGEAQIGLYGHTRINFFPGFKEEDSLGTLGHLLETIRFAK